jgi:hypothetical protein
VFLSYLSFEDKIRFECVSKQFQKSIFNKQFIIEIDGYPNRKENTLKKSKFVNEVYIRVNNKKLNEIILKLIIKYCYYLKSIAFNFEQISQQLIEEFGLKFEQKLSQISFKATSNSVDKHKKLLRLCPNINGFIDGHITDLSVFVGNDSVLVPKLSKIGLRPKSQDFDYIENFAKTYGNSLKSVLFEACLGVDDIESSKYYRLQ